MKKAPDLSEAFHFFTTVFLHGNNTSYKLALAGRKLEIDKSTRYNLAPARDLAGRF